MATFNVISGSVAPSSGPPSTITTLVPGSDYVAIVDCVISTNFDIPGFVNLFAFKRQFWIWVGSKWKTLVLNNGDVSYSTVLSVPHSAAIAKELTLRRRLSASSLKDLGRKGLPLVCMLQRRTSASFE